MVDMTSRRPFTADRILRATTFRKAAAEIRRLRAMLRDASATHAELIEAHKTMDARCARAEAKVRGTEAVEKQLAAYRDAINVLHGGI
jgi:hypothetical protein